MLAPNALNITITLILLAGNGILAFYFWRVASRNIQERTDSIVAIQKELDEFYDKDIAYFNANVGVALILKSRIISRYESIVYWQGQYTRAWLFAFLAALLLLKLLSQIGDYITATTSFI